MSKAARNIVLYDGVCALCNGFVKFLIKVDRKKRFHFCSQQSEIGKQILEQAKFPSERLNSIVLYLEEKNSYLIESDAIMDIFSLLEYPWRLLQIFKVIPRPLRDLVYRFVSRSRYRTFGRYDVCPMPLPEVRDRFLE